MCEKNEAKARAQTLEGEQNEEFHDHVLKKGREKYKLIQEEYIIHNTIVYNVYVIYLNTNPSNNLCST